MSTETKRAVPPPPTAGGFRIFVRSSYTARYNFAVANYNSVSVKPKSFMRDGFVLLYRSVVAVVWIISMAFAVLALFKGTLAIGAIVLSLLYILLTLYNAYVFFDNRNLLNSPRLLQAKVAGPNGLDYEWVSVPLDSRSANERLAAVDQSALDNVRREYAGNAKNGIDCMVYTSRYADTYPSFPKELLLHLLAFLVAIGLSIVMAII
jgi:hypothetical protein